MKGKSTSPTGITEKLAWIRIGLGAFWWFLKGTIEVPIFQRGNLVHQLRLITEHL